MNKDRRKAIEDAQEQIEGGLDTLREVRDDEQAYFENMPESLQGGEKGDLAQSAISCLDNAIDALEGIDLDDALA